MRNSQRCRAGAQRSHIRCEMDLVSNFYRRGEALRQLLCALAANPDGRVLDVGCKTGDVSEAIAQRVQSLVALDPIYSDRWLSRDSRISFVNGDGVHLPFQNEAFDGIIAGESFQYINDRFKALDECRRVVKPGGLLTLSFPEWGPFAVYLDPDNLHSLLRMVTAPRAAHDPFVRHPRAKAMIQYAAAHWDCIVHYRRGSILFIYIALAIDLLQSVRRRLLRCRAPIRGLTDLCVKPLIKLLFVIMNLDFAISWGPLSYNNVIQLRKRES